MSLASKIGEDLQDDITPTIPKKEVMLFSPQPRQAMPGATKKLLVQVDMETHIRLKILAARQQTTLEAICREGLEAFAKTQS